MLDELEKDELIQIIENLKKENKALKEQLYGKVEKEETEQEQKNISREEKLNGKLDVASFQSLFKKDNIEEIVKNYGLVIVDECHDENNKPRIILATSSSIQKQVTYVACFFNAFFNIFYGINIKITFSKDT